MRKIFASLVLILFLCSDSFNSGAFAAKRGKKAGKSSRRSAGSSKKTKKAGGSSRRSAGSSKKTKKAGGSSRRSASSSKRSSRRSASSSKRSSRRSAGSSRSSRRSAGGRSSRRSAFGSSGRGGSVRGGGSYSGGEAEFFQTYGLPACPLDRALWQNPDEERENVYYKSKKSACHGPENSESNDWKKDSKIAKLPWIADDEAVVLSCGSGYLKAVKDKKYVCMDESSFCPLNKQVVEKKGKSYINAATEEECNKPVGANAVKLTKEQLSASGYEIKFGKAFYLKCKENYYSEESGVKCGKCPNFYTSVQGENEGRRSCKPTKECEKDFRQSEVTGECEKTPEAMMREAIEICGRQKQAYAYDKKDINKCKACDSGFEPDADGNCQMTPNEKEKRAIAECLRKIQGYENGQCKTCQEHFAANKVTGKCEEIPEHKVNRLKKECFSQKQLYNYSTEKCDACQKGYEFKREGDKDPECVKTKETLREEAIALCAAGNKAYGWDDSVLSKCGDECSDGYEPKSGKCFETEKSKRRKLFQYAINNKNIKSLWSLVESNKTSGTLEAGVYKVVVAGGSGGNGGDANVAGGYGYGASGQILDEIFKLDKSTTYYACIGSRGADGRWGRYGGSGGGGGAGSAFVLADESVVVNVSGGGAGGGDSSGGGGGGGGGAGYGCAKGGKGGYGNDNYDNIQGGSVDGASNLLSSGLVGRDGAEDTGPHGGAGGWGGKSCGNGGSGGSHYDDGSSGGSCVSVNRNSGNGYVKIYKYKD